MVEITIFHLEGWKLSTSNKVSRINRRAVSPLLFRLYKHPQRGRMSDSIYYHRNNNHQHSTAVAAFFTVIRSESDSMSWKQEGDDGSSNDTNSCVNRDTASSYTHSPGLLSTQTVAAVQTEQLPNTHTHKYGEANAPTHLHSHCNYTDSCRCQVITSSAWCKLSRGSYLLTRHFLISCLTVSCRYSSNYSAFFSLSLLFMSDGNLKKQLMHWATFWLLYLIAPIKVREYFFYGWWKKSIEIWVYCWLFGA